MKHYPSNIYQVTAAGGVVTVAAGSPIQNLVLYSGTATLGSGFTVAQSGTFRDGDTIHCYLYLTDLSNGGQTLTVLGEPITSSLYENANLHIVARYSSISGKFQLHLNPEFDSGASFIITDYIRDRAVTTDKLENDAVTTDKLANITRGSIIVGGAADAPTVRDFSTDAQILIGDGTDANSVAVSGDIAITNAGVTTIQDGVVTPAKLSFSLASYLEVTRTLSSAEVLAGYSANTNTGYDFIAAPGSNKYIELVSVSAMLNYNSVTYNAGTDTLNLECNGVAIWTFPNSFIEATADAANQGTRVDNAAIALNTAVKLHLSSADPAAGGNSTITVKAIYRICDFV